MNADLLLVPYDSGSRSERLGRGPEHFIASGLVESLQSSGHDVRVGTIESSAEFLMENALTFELARLLSDRVRASLQDGRFPLVLAGNCTSSLGTFAGLGAVGTGVIWFDAHGDLNTPEISPTGFLDGMAISILTGRCWKESARGVSGFSPVEEEHLVLVGARDFDSEEAKEVESSGIALVRPGTIREQGIRNALGPELDQLRRRVERVYLHIDLDVLDPAEGQANHLPVPGGLTVAEVLEAVEAIGARFEIPGAALTAYDPSYDAEGRVLRAGLEIAGRIFEVAESDEA